MLRGGLGELLRRDLHLVECRSDDVQVLMRSGDGIGEVLEVGLDLLDHIVHRRDVRDDHLCSLIGKGPRDVPAHALCSAGNDDGLVSDTHVVTYPHEQSGTNLPVTRPPSTARLVGL